MTSVYFRCHSYIHGDYDMLGSPTDRYDLVMKFICQPIAVCISHGVWEGCKKWFGGTQSALCLLKCALVNNEHVLKRILKMPL